MRASAVKGASALMLSPWYDGSVRSPIVSVPLLRGFANWPAMRPILTTGWPPPYVHTRLICSSTRKVSRTWSTENSSKDSAQSPPKRTKPSPLHARPSSAWSVRTSPAKTSGAEPASSSSAFRRATGSGYFGICLASKLRHEPGDQGDSMLVCRTCRAVRGTPRGAGARRAIARGRVNRSKLRPGRPPGDAIVSAALLYQVRELWQALEK
mmetsp:Transcript_6177/g.18258  ORF Transcript_6177/g.18258 Transcript_6177/m.18258 type:complete len:210 (-) Transcript_6177:32-661(-)